MRRLLITPRFPPQCCGVGDFTAQLARSLQAQGEAVLVLTEPGAGPRPADIPVRELPLRGWRNLPGVLRAIRSQPASQVQLEYSNYGWGRWGFSFAVNALAFALRLRGHRLTLGLHELYLPLTARPLGLLCGLIQRAHFVLLFLAASSIETNTPQRVRRVQRWLPWRANSVRFRPTPSNISVTTLAREQIESLRRARGATAESLVIATFGSFHPAKNYEAVIDATLQLRAQLPVQVWLLGNPQSSAHYVAALRRRAVPLGDAAFWPGLACAEQVSGWLQAADIFVLPQSDGHLTRSGAFMAAAAHGLPVVAVRNQAEQIDFRHREHIYLVDRGSSEAFAAAILELAQDRPLRSRLGANLRDLYFSRFDWMQLLRANRAASPAREAAAGTVASPAAGSKG
jgi:glycosyltransferase involved in cell wall biosynthesis